MLPLEETFLSMCRSSRAIMFRFSSKPQWQMFLLLYFIFVSLRRTQTWLLHTKLYKFGWHTSANNVRIKDSRDLILGEVVYISIIYGIPDSWLDSLNGFDSWFWSHDWWKPRIDHRASEGQLGTKNTKASTPTHVTTTLNVIGWFKLQLWMWLAYWTVR